MNPSNEKVPHTGLSWSYVPVLLNAKLTMSVLGSSRVVSEAHTGVDARLAVAELMSDIRFGGPGRRICPLAQLIDRLTGKTQVR